MSQTHMTKIINDATGATQNRGKAIGLAKYEPGLKIAATASRFLNLHFSTKR